MLNKTGEEIMSAMKPSQIFTMNLSVIEQEKDDYLEQFKPKEYNTIKNFMVTQKVIQLYRQAISELENNRYSSGKRLLELIGKNGESFAANYQYVYDNKLGKMYVTQNNVVFVIEAKYEKYYRNYIEKTKSFPHLDKNVWDTIEYSLPKVLNYFQDTSGNWIIVIEKPSDMMYPLREILDFFGGKLQPEYVASILTRLYNFVCYLEIIGINHNAITVENLFFAPGKNVEKGAEYSIEEMRIVGVYGGWFFSTNRNEKVNGMPRKVNDILLPNSIQNGYSSFEVDALAVKQVARELLGDITGRNLENVPSSLVDWVNDSYIRNNAYEEFTSWEKARRNSFKKHRFVEMDVSID